MGRKKRVSTLFWGTRPLRASSDLVARPRPKYQAGPPSRGRSSPNRADNWPREAHGPHFGSDLYRNTYARRVATAIRDTCVHVGRGAIAQSVDGQRRLESYATSMGTRTSIRGKRLARRGCVERGDPRGPVPRCCGGGAPRDVRSLHLAERSRQAILVGCGKRNIASLS